jgi:hypothetical protein
MFARQEPQCSPGSAPERPNFAAIDNHNGDAIAFQERDLGARQVVRLIWRHGATLDQ